MHKLFELTLNTLSLHDLGRRMSLLADPSRSPQALAVLGHGFVSHYGFLDPAQ